MLMAQAAALVEKAEEVRRFIAARYRYPFAARVVLPDPQRDAAPWLEVRWTRSPPAVLDLVPTMRQTWPAIEFRFVYVEECDL